jgi:hypothetical protein
MLAFAVLLSCPSPVVRFWDYTYITSFGLNGELHHASVDYRCYPRDAGLFWGLGAGWRFSGGGSVIHELIPRNHDYRPRDFDRLLNTISQPGQFLSAIDDFIAHPPPHFIMWSD